MGHSPRCSTVFTSATGDDGAGCVIEGTGHAVSELVNGFFFSVGYTFHFMRVYGDNAHTVGALAHSALFALHTHIYNKYIVILCGFYKLFQLSLPSLQSIASVYFFPSSNNVVFGCDDGTIYANKNSKAVSLNKNTGKLIDTLPIVGDQRSTITYQNGTLYFTTKAGYLYSVKLNANGTFNDSAVKRLSLGGASTSTPLIYNGRLYLGVQGSGFGPGYFKVIDATKLTVIYSAQTKGYPQGKFLLSDAYLKDTGKVNIYITYNCAPGGVTMFKDSAGQTKADMQELYTPSGDKSNYCISSIIADKNGTIFYKNDSGYIFALRNKTEKVSFFKKIINAIASFFKKLFG